MNKRHSVMATWEQVSGEKTTCAAHVQVQLQHVKFKLEDDFGSVYNLRMNQLEVPQKSEDPTVLELWLAEKHNERVVKIRIEATADVVESIFSKISSSMEQHQRAVKNDSTFKYNCPEEEKLLEWKAAIDDLPISFPGFSHADVFYAEVYYAFISLNGKVNPNDKRKIKEKCGQLTQKYYPEEYDEDDECGEALVEFLNRSDGAIRRYSLETSEGGRKNSKWHKKKNHRKKAAKPLLYENPADISFFEGIHKDDEEEEPVDEEEEDEEVDDMEETMETEEKTSECDGIEYLDAEDFTADDMANLEPVANYPEYEYVPSASHSMIDKSTPSFSHVGESISASVEEQLPPVVPSAQYNNLFGGERHLGAVGNSLPVGFMTENEKNRVPQYEKISEEHSYSVKKSPELPRDSPFPFLNASPSSSPLKGYLPERQSSPPLPNDAKDDENIVSQEAEEPAFFEDPPTQATPDSPAVADFESPLDSENKSEVDPTSPQRKRHNSDTDVSMGSTSGDEVKVRRLKRMHREKKETERRESMRLGICLSMVERREDSSDDEIRLRTKNKKRKRPLDSDEDELTATSLPSTPPKQKATAETPLVDPDAAVEEVVVICHSAEEDLENPVDCAFVEPEVKKKESVVKATRLRKNNKKRKNIFDSDEDDLTATSPPSTPPKQKATAETPLADPDAAFEEVVVICHSVEEDVENPVDCAVEVKKKESEVKAIRIRTKNKKRKNLLDSDEDDLTATSPPKQKATAETPLVDPDAAVEEVDVICHSVENPVESDCAVVEPAVKKKESAVEAIRLRKNNKKRKNIFDSDEDELTATSLPSTPPKQKATSETLLVDPDADVEEVAVICHSVEEDVESPVDCAVVEPEVRKKESAVNAADWSGLLLNKLSPRVVRVCGAEKLKLRIDVILDNTFNMLVACKNRESVAEAVSDVLNSKYRKKLKKIGIGSWPADGGFARILITMFRAYDDCFANPAHLPTSCLVCGKDGFADSEAVEAHVMDKDHLRRIKWLDMEEDYMRERRVQFSEGDGRREKAYQLADKLTFPTDMDAMELIGKYQISMEKWLRVFVDVLSKRALSGAQTSSNQRNTVTLQFKEEEDDGSMPETVGEVPADHSDDEEIEVVYFSGGRTNRGQSAQPRVKIEVVDIADDD